MSQFAPICLFTYDRIDETVQTIQSLKKNFLAKQSDLIIFSDGPKNKKSHNKIFELRQFLKTITGFKSITIHESIENKGLANSIINGVSKTLKEYGNIIVLEDDLITTPNFLDFMNQALEYYAKDDKIQSINGYSLKIKSNEDVYFHERTFPWGWATWQNRWFQELFDKKIIEERIQENNKLLSRFNKTCGNDMSSMLEDTINGKNNSWYSRWVFNHFLNETYAVYPTLSKVSNIGFSDKATHCSGINTYQCKIDNSNKQSFLFTSYKKLKRKENHEFLNYFSKKYKFFFRLKMLRNPSNWNRLLLEIKNKLFS